MIEVLLTVLIVLALAIGGGALVVSIAFVVSWIDYRLRLRRWVRRGEP